MEPSVAIILEIVATIVVASWPPERCPTGTPTACAKMLRNCRRSVLTLCGGAVKIVSGNSQGTIQEGIVKQVSRKYWGNVQEVLKKRVLMGKGSVKESWLKCRGSVEEVLSKGQVLRMWIGCADGQGIVENMSRRRYGSVVEVEVHIEESLYCCSIKEVYEESVENVLRIGWLTVWLKEFIASREAIKSWQ